MTEDTKGAIEIALMVLKKTLIDEGVSMAVGIKKEELHFFDTYTYLNTGKFDGIKVPLESLVK